MPSFHPDGVMGKAQRLRHNALARLREASCPHGALAAVYCTACVREEERYIALEERIKNVEARTGIMAARLADQDDREAADAD